jgi:hypothetical protein
MSKRRVAVVFVHGLARKPPPAKLAEIWAWGLHRDNPMPTVFAAPNPGIALRTQGIPSSFCYYADVFYGEDYETDYDAYYEAGSAGELQQEGLQDIEDGLVPPAAITPRERTFVRDFEANLRASIDVKSDEALAGAALGGYEIAGFLPAPWREAIIKKAAMEAYYFLFDKEFVRQDGKRFQVRAELRERLKAELRTAAEAADKVVLVAHSMGTMLAYDVLRNCPDAPTVDVLFTLGSPLGLREVQAELSATGDGVDFPAQKLGAWFNFYDPLDPICAADPRLAKDFAAAGGKAITDVAESNWGSWRHTITHYYAGTRFRAAFAAALGIPLG